MEISPVHNACSLEGLGMGNASLLIRKQDKGRSHSRRQSRIASRMRRQKINSFICRKFNVTMLSVLAQRQFSTSVLAHKGGLKLKGVGGRPTCGEGYVLIDCAKD